ncbi:hypothetical protein FBU59_001550 [Linderina macrospora]|uniref:Uncharacterized protein n=1 Tax=Linderina macrospora TaxID=4868 RepID=A0ACC1JDZ2_9FUNG|nr:hypothetical protein FBU59_001550 [Linderina macrospora]
MCEDDYYKYGDIYVAAPDTVALSNPSDCRTVMGSHSFKKSQFYEGLRVIDENMLLTRDAAFNQLRRRQIGPAFTPGYLQCMEPTILECGILALKKKWDKLINNGHGSVKIDYHMDFSLATFDVISALGYSQQFHAVENSESKIILWMTKYRWLSVINAICPLATTFPFSLLIRPLLKSKEEYVRFTNAAAERRREQTRRGEKVPNDILQALIDGEDPESKAKMTPTQVTAEHISILGAATDTTALTMTWALHYLMLYPECYRKATEEVRSAFTSDHLIGYSEGRSQLPYVEACIYESLRIRAVTGGIMLRDVPPGGVTFQGHYLPAGMVVGINIAGLNHHQDVWKDSKRFMPERFIDDPKLKQSVMTFSSGVRICPGRALAWSEMITIVANLLKDYDFKLPKGSLYGPHNTDESGMPVVMPRPKNPERDCIIIVTKRML